MKMQIFIHQVENYPIISSHSLWIPLKKKDCSKLLLFSEWVYFIRCLSGLKSHLRASLGLGFFSVDFFLAESKKRSSLYKDRFDYVWDIYYVTNSQVLLMFGGKGTCIFKLIVKSFYITLWVRSNFFILFFFYSIFYLCLRLAFFISTHIIRMQIGKAQH